MSKKPKVAALPEPMTRPTPSGGTEDVYVFANGRRARVRSGAVQLLDCRNDEHEARLFARRDGLDADGVLEALRTIAALHPPTPHRYDR